MKEGKPSVYFVKDSLQHHQPKKPCQAHAGHLYLYLKSNPHSSSSHNMPTRHNIAHSRHIVLLSGLFDLFDLSDLSLSHSLSLSRSLSLSLVPHWETGTGTLLMQTFPAAIANGWFWLPFTVWRLLFAVVGGGLLFLLLLLLILMVMVMMIRRRRRGDREWFGCCLIFVVQSGLNGRSDQS